ncbi:MAG: DUF2309 domain-containing protein [Aquificae bacterium]|nr:DUF2309 domain-containing protein [Aquificota bacterium]
MIKENLDYVKGVIPKYWPIITFIHHNPLTGFEKKNFREGLKLAKDIFKANVYMPAEYYVSLYKEGKIKQHILEENLSKVLKEHNLVKHFHEARTFLIEISPRWESFRTYKSSKQECINRFLIDVLKRDSQFKDANCLITHNVKYYTLYEIFDAIFDTDKKEIIERDIIEYISRFLDQEQTTLSMYQRHLGMFNTFKYYEGLDFSGDAQAFIKEILDNLKVPQKEISNYFLSHLLKQAGWAGFIKYRESDDYYYWQQEYPASLIDYLAVRLYYEWKHMKNEKINNYEKLNNFIEKNREFVALKILKYNSQLPPKYIDWLEEGQEPKKILESYVKEELELDALQIQLAKKELPTFEGDLIEFAKFVKVLKEEEGFIWLKSLEDSYIETYVNEFFSSSKAPKDRLLASLVMCIDVRSEAVRRYMERIGPYNTYGIAGFLRMPITFIEFDKDHEQFLCPAIIKPNNVVFELPKERHEEYKAKKGFTKTLKKVLNDLKNNPYTPFITVEAIGWLFGINLFGKTFFPREVDRFFSKFRPKKPKTTYIIDKLSQEDIELFAKKVHFKFIQEIVSAYLKRDLTEIETEEIWKHLIFGEPLSIKVPNEILEKLKEKYNITKEDYEFQKRKLSQVGFSLDEQVMYLENFLKTIGLVSDFPKFVLIVGHGSKSDNNPFESALDCGACGGNISFPNARAMCMIGNREEVRKKLEERGIKIPSDVKFLPGLHITTTDEIEFYDTEILNDEEEKLFAKVLDDIKFATSRSREERIKTLPYTETEEDIFIKAIDWSEPRPEWGLSKNVAAYVGKRESIKHLTLHNRFFLVSYDWKIDDDKVSILTALFSGPLIVGEWINLEHYFSTVDNEIFGAGSKVYHNIVSKVGVFYGNYSDLKIGLPTQTVLLEDKPYHEPTRLIVFLEAPMELALKATKASELASPIILNEWIRLVLIDEKDGKIYKFEDGEFKLIKEIDYCII